MVTIKDLRPTERPLVMDLVAAAGLDVSDWPNYKGIHPASNPRYCYEWAFAQEGKPPVACLWFGSLELGPDGSVQQRLNLWQVAKKHESLEGKSNVAKRARAMDMVLQKAFGEHSEVRVIVVDGDQADLVSQTKKSSRVQRRMLDPVAWRVAEYDQSTGECLLVRGGQAFTADDRAREDGQDLARGFTAPAAETVPTYVTRLAYNSKQWRRPVAATEAQEAGDTYRSENGFGHEDWLFRNEWELDGWRYAFVQGVNRSRAKLLREGTPFNLRLFTMPASGDRRAVAEIRGAECLDDQTAVAAVAAFERQGWLDTMRAEVTAAGGRPEALDETGYAPHVLNFRFRLSNVSMLNGDSSLPPDDPTHRLTRYGLYDMAGAMDRAVAGIRSKDLQAETPPLSSADYRHALESIEISESQKRWLVAHYYSPDATTSMLQLSNALGYPDHRAANGAYGALAKKVASELQRAPDDIDDDGYADWLQALARLVEPDALNHSQWRLRDEVVQAMLALRWVEAPETASDVVVELPTADDQRVAREYGLDDTQIMQMMLSRRGQGRFRSETLRFWGGRCAVSGLPETCFLVASHIKPWKDSKPDERLDGYNGLPLTPNLDRAFDRGYVSFAEDGSIMISPALNRESMQALGISHDMGLRICDERIGRYLAYHREHVFIQTA